MMDSISFMSLSSILKDSQNGVVLEMPQIKYNTPQLIKSDTRIITRPFGNEWSPGQLENNESFEGVGIINLDGAITLSGGMSSIGMEQLASMMELMATDKRMVGFVVRANSGGGSSSAVQTMVDSILKVRKTHTVLGSIKKGGMSASACHMILTACEQIYSEDEMNIVGSFGTMVQFEGREANTVDKDGVKYIRLYATKSVRKNEDFEKALNENNYDLIINNLLDPINENALKMSIKNRPQLKGNNFDDGHTAFSKDAIGTFIDGIASFEQVVEMVISESKIKTKNNKSNINSNSLKMTKQEIKQEHPNSYAEIVSEGVIQERERVSSWMKYSSADPEAVSLGIVNGTEISPSQREDFLIKMHSKTQISNLQADNAKPINTPESATVIVEEASKNEELESAFKFEL